MPTNLQVFEKAANSILAFSVDINDFVTAEGVGIPAVTWTIPTGLTEEALQFQDNVAVAYLGGGTRRKFYSVRLNIIDNGGVIRDQQDFVIRVV